MESKRYVTPNSFNLNGGGCIRLAGPKGENPSYMNIYWETSVHSFCPEDLKWLRDKLIEIYPFDNVSSFYRIVEDEGCYNVYRITQEFYHKKSSEFIASFKDHEKAGEYCKFLEGKK